MSLEEQLEDQERMLWKAFAEKRPDGIIYKMMEVYEDLYAELKNPTPEQECNYIKLYFKYDSYSRRN